MTLCIFEIPMEDLSYFNRNLVVPKPDRACEVELTGFCTDVWCPAGSLVMEIIHPRPVSW